MHDSSSQSTNTSPNTADLYDFENSEENFMLFLSLDLSRVKPQAQRSMKAKNIKEPKRLRTNVKVLNKSIKKISFPKPQSSKLLRPAAKSSKPSNVDFIRSTSTKHRKSSTNVMFDSGVFMTPSPVQVTPVGPMLKDSKSSSTPSEMTPRTTNPLGNTRKLEKPLVSPPNVSPVKRYESPNTGGIHGVLVISHTESLTMPAASDTLLTSEKLQADESPLIHVDLEPIKTLDISKTFRCFVI